MSLKEDSDWHEVRKAQGSALHASRAQTPCLTGYTAKGTSLRLLLSRWRRLAATCFLLEIKSRQTLLTAVAHPLEHQALYPKGYSHILFARERPGIEIGVPFWLLSHALSHVSITSSFHNERYAPEKITASSSSYSLCFDSILTTESFSIKMPALIFNGSYIDDVKLADFLKKV